MKTFLDGRVTLHAGDCLDVVLDMASNSIDSCVTDPPYAINFMSKEWDTGETAFAVEFWAEVLRVLKPGGHVAAFGGTRSYHRLACAIEDAGFEIRDQLAWAYGCGFPKSHSVVLAIEKLNGAPHRAKSFNTKGGGDRSDEFAENGREHPAPYAPATDAARQWEGWGTALKPAWEPICLARKPLSEKTVAANVLRWGTGAINVDGCRVGTTDALDRVSGSYVGTGFGMKGGNITEAHALGRFPANLCHDGSDEVLAAFPSPHGAGAARADPGGGEFKSSDNGWGNIGSGTKGFRIGDSGSAARFFYSAKASKADRALSKHPTVKPVKLMQWLVRLITPPGGVTLDPFSGTGTTGEAAWREGFSAVLIEREEEYQADIERRMLFAKAREKPEPQAASAALRQVDQEPETLPLPLAC